MEFFQHLSFAKITLPLNPDNKWEKTKCIFQLLGSGSEPCITTLTQFYNCSVNIMWCELLSNFLNLTRQKILNVRGLEPYKNQHLGAILDLIFLYTHHTQLKYIGRYFFFS